MTTATPIRHHHHGATNRRHHDGGTAPYCLVLLSLLCSVEAQSYGTSSSRGPYPGRGRFNPAMGIVVLVLVSIFFFMVFLSIYLRRRGERSELSGGPAGGGARALQAGRSRLAAVRGLDAAVIQTFPTLVYAEVKEHKIGKGALECAVCLSEFEDDETLRLLPMCDHVFHRDCIDAWLSSHTTCPVCRTNLAPDPNATAAATAAEATANPSADAAASDATVSEETEREVAAGGWPQDHVAIDVDESEAGDRMTRMESKSRLRWRWSRSLVRPPRFPRSHSTGHSMAVVRPREDHERYTLRLPDHIRRDVMAGKLQRSSSSAAFAGKGTQAEGEGTSRGGGGPVGGRSFKLRRWEWAAKSDRWAFLARTFSMRTLRSDDGAAEGSAQRGEGLARKGVEGSGRGATAAGREGSVKGKVVPV